MARRKYEKVWILQGLTSSTWRQPNAPTNCPRVAYFVQRTGALHRIPQHELLAVRTEVHLLVHPVRHRVAAWVMLQPVRSYVSGTNPCR